MGWDGMDGMGDGWDRDGVLEVVKKETWIGL